uniref:Transmembrane protein n=1 Tax=Glossina brevipalpis TaxID=37001 RepID=A0A1A9WXL0_9MUSC
MKRICRRYKVTTTAAIPKWQLYLHEAPLQMRPVEETYTLKSESSNDMGSICLRIMTASLCIISWPSLLHSSSSLSLASSSSSSSSSPSSPSSPSLSAVAAAITKTSSSTSFASTLWCYFAVVVAIVVVSVFVKTLNTFIRMCAEFVAVSIDCSKARDFNK